MEGKVAEGLTVALFMVSIGLLAAPRADAANTNSKLRVGIVILDSCRLDTTAANPPTTLAGFGLKCAKGTGYTYEVSPPSQPVGGLQTRTSVTVRF